MSRSMWYFDHDGRVGGPVSVSQLRQLAANGELLPTDRVRKEDMDRWVKARAVKGLFTPADMPSPLELEAIAEPIETETVFDFFGVGPAPPAEPAKEFHPAFDFFGGPIGPLPTKPASPPATVVPQPVVPPPARKSTPARKSIPDLPPPRTDVPLEPPVKDRGSFLLTVPTATPVEEPIPYVNVQIDVPMAMPASDTGMQFASVTAELTGPEVEMSSDGTARLPGSVVELSVIGGWLAAKSATPDGSGNETYLGLIQLTAVTLRDRPGVGRVLSFHAGAQAVAVQCDGNAKAAEAFLRRVLEAAG